MYTEDEYLQLSGIQHFAFCRRQWALAYIEQQWQENVRTAEGRILHQNAHDASLKEKRGETIIVRAMPVSSAELGISGECDVVEFQEDEKGITLNQYSKRYRAVPIEYKRGSPKAEDADLLQLAAQAMCLEEMLCCEISVGYIYYGETRRRLKVEISEELREKVKKMLGEMHQYYERSYTPTVKRTKSCNACSLKEICLPILNKKRSVKSYIMEKVEEAVE